MIAIVGMRDTASAEICTISIRAVSVAEKYL